ncbi:protein SODIUM POTASSIUM ROOT DEFECTIVE 3-like [Rhodamnia argentea]|uniref:Protein SODIUM POTASSIUM ROOT DEFECTIVE 3-like n=1 Tax=Rhodamnia argentea TaxID=178133 RepID=A0A8B8Q8E0_9MYRT|nr:protein SODIUM POTASSIUM ROOT DEFECTIVE 3-like [Rhodamnia argentea]
MKEIHSLHASQASTSTATLMDKSSSVGLGGRAIDRHNPIITDSRRLTTKQSPTSALHVPSRDPPSQLKPHHHQLQSTSKKGSSKPTPRDESKISPKSSEGRKDSVKDSSLKKKDVMQKTIALPGDLCTPPSSSRYLLSDTVLINDDSALTSVLDEHKKSQSSDRFERFGNSNPSASSRSKPTSDQVVVLRVSLHCRGCEGKVRKHLSKMAGVTSFNIDSAAKKVTVVGDVTPLSVLASVSKVKTARFWPFAPAVSSTNGSDSKI